MHVSLLMFSAVKDYAHNAYASSNIEHSTVLYSFIHTAVTCTANVNSINGFTSDYIIPSIQYRTVDMMSV